MEVRRVDVFLVNLDPAVQSEIRTRRPRVTVSPDEMNRHVRTMVVTPMTTAGRLCPTRIRTRFGGKEGPVVVDQLRTVDKARLVRHLGALESAEAAALLDVLREFFAP